MNKEPAKTTYERVKKANAALIARGGKRMPSGYLQPDAARALAALVDAGYADTPGAVVAMALLDAQKKVTRSVK